MEPYIVLADKQVNGHRRGLAFSALPDAPVLAPTTPGVLRRQVTRIARWTRVRPEGRDRAGRAVLVRGAAVRPQRSGSSVPARSVAVAVPAGCGSATRLG